LFAVGEVSGFGGINGKHGLEGTFLGPGLVMGRVAARTILAELNKKPAPAPHDRPAIEFVSAKSRCAADELCVACHVMPQRLEQSLPGYWHFEKVHRVVLEKQFSCSSCHAEVNASPASDPAAHRIDRRRQLQTCAVCHQGESR
jgi:nitrate/TMAO reductase-like tetraheme cytochrome c subunit